jgi:hypothetical protein
MADEQEAGSLLPPGCGLWIGWLAANILGSFLGWFAGWRASFAAPGGLSTIVIGGVMGLILGFMQGLILRGYLRAAGWWVLASALGWGAGFSTGVLFAQWFSSREFLFGILVGTMTGAILGIAQWVILRGHVTKAGWWIPASAFAWASSLLYYRPGSTGLGALFGILSGIVTGTVLLWLFHRPVAD